MSDRAWIEMLAEFRALGGTAENICVRKGPIGRGLFPSDPAKPVTIQIPSTLLVDIADVEFVEGKFRVSSRASVGNRARAFLESYEDQFSWGSVGRSEIERIFEQAQMLPAEMRRTLKVDYHCGAWFEDVTDALIQRQFIMSRSIRYKDGTVVMPIVELANHGLGASYATRDGVGLQGQFSGEVLVRYADFDAHGTFSTWGFAFDQPQAFSIALGGKVGKNGVRINRDLGGVVPGAPFWIPEFAAGDGGAQLRFLMLGNKHYPKHGKSIFYKIMRQLGFSDYEEAFETIQHANRLFYLNLWALIETADGPMAPMLRRMVQNQLRALSYCYGTTAI
jgi:hypothetical protein